MSETKENVTTVAVQDTHGYLAEVKAESDRFELRQREAKALMASSFLPDTYRGKLAECMMAIDIASKMGIVPITVMNKLYSVHGRLGWASEFLIACFNQTGRFSVLDYRFEGEEGSENWGCRAVATELKSGKELVGTKITMSMAKAEGWATKSGSKWRTMPEQMLRYRSAAFFIRAYAPEVSMGFPTADELEDVMVSKQVGVTTPAPNNAISFDMADDDEADATDADFEPVTENEDVDN